MTKGRLVAVVGPSGVGKDSVMAALKNAIPTMHQMRRVVTRAKGTSGEGCEAVLADDFAAMAANGTFVVHWRACGLCYGIPLSVQDHLNAGTDCLVNFSCRALAEASTIFPHILALNITAQPGTLAKRRFVHGHETE